MHEVLHRVIYCVHHLMVHSCVASRPWLHAQYIEYQSVCIHVAFKERCAILQKTKIAVGLALVNRMMLSSLHPLSVSPTKPQ